MALFRQPSKGLLTSLAVLSGLAAAAACMQPASAQEPAACLSFNPADWPAPARPYFMLVVDTSGSMTACTTPPTNYPTECNQNAAGYALNSCGMNPSRLNDAKCALRQTVQAFSGEVNFGLATFASYLSGCSGGACGSDCGTPNGGTCNSDYYDAKCNWNVFQDAGGTACGNTPACSGAGPSLPNLPEGTWRNGANVVFGITKDAWWLPPGQPQPNTAELLQWFDGQCDSSRELFAAGSTPIAGSLEAVTQYLRAGWTRWTNSNYCPNPTYTFGTPADTNDRACRSINVILLTDGDESCDSQSDAVNAASNLFNNGVTIGGKTWKVPVHVINFAGGSVTATNQIAAAGGTSASILANNEVQLASAFAQIIGGAIKPEVCNNGDDNCNGCTDEGYKHYCNQQQTCCAWSTQGQRTTCLNNYTASISPADPDGNQALLPCTTPTQQTQPANWLCYNPGDVCDENDNNCSDGVDEGQLKCGNPAACPSTEICDGKDNDCDNQIDEIGGCAPCIPSPEICDGCDNDCDGVADDGVAAIPCGLASPPNCAGTQACSAPQNVPVGTCVAGGGYQPCNNSPLPEICDMIDNDCDGITDDGVPGIACVPAGTPPGLNYNPPSQCKMGTQACGSSVCSGFVGPSTEVCDNIDNDCDGQVDEGATGVGSPCGTAISPCTPGTLACVAGVLTCQGGTQPTAEVCDNVDNNCNGVVDDAPLQDAPAAGMNGCWTDAGNCCSFAGLQWCPPAGATCNGTGTLTSPCSAGTLVCSMGGWTCQGPLGPSAEVCDSADNDCDGMVDDVTGVGLPCGTDQGECVAGVAQCSANGIICVGAVGPTTEVCDNKDNDCDGAIDDGVPGVGQPCGVNQPPCTLGTTACVGGMVVCQGGVQPQGELCDGIDNNCDGLVDNAPLADAPPPNLNGCWSLPGNCCSFGGFEWCPPPGASCSDVGTLMPPCNKGSLACQGALGWVCQGDNPPQAEACDGLDNNCDGAIDEGMFPGEGAVCGSDEGECVSGLIDCAGGILDCVGDVGPKSELCNGLDDDCDGVIDNGIVVGGSCTPMYDTTLYPGPRDKGACMPGILECDGMGGNVCVGGTGPQPEVCDGIDNDCDGAVDETGPAPDGIDGTANPSPPPMASVGDLCGVDTGACQQGQYACVNGLFQCLGGTGPQEESCDCDDNDCDGTNDEQDPNASPICAPGNSCVKSGTVCACAAPCDVGEFPCPPGQKCEDVIASDTGTNLGPFCIPDNCGDCTKKTVLNADNTVLCAPAGTPADANCVVPPVCVCKGAATGCKNPCDGVTCAGGEICTDYGPNAGKCVPNNCYGAPCQGCDQVCNNGSCVTNPCKPDSCPGQVCQPSGDFTTFTCIETCAGKQCNPGEVCKNGTCVADCSPMCAAGQVCDYTQMPPACVTNNCTMPCANGGVCDPVTGMCGNDPCAGVVCPSGQTCQDGDCFAGQGGSGGSGGSGGGGVGGGETTSSSSSGSSGMGGAAGAAADTGVWGLPTGGGGCACEVGAKDRTSGFAWALAALALGIWRRRTTGRRSAQEVSR